MAGVISGLSARARRALGAEGHRRWLCLPRRLFAKGNFVIFHIGRSGSTVVTDLLNRQPGIHCDGELFHCFYGDERTRAQERGDSQRWPWDNSPYYPDRPLQFLQSNMTRHGLRSWYGLEMKFFHLDFNGLSLPSFLDALEHFDFQHFVVLERRNYLRVIVSSVIAQTRDHWHVDVSEDAPRQRAHLAPDAIQNDGVCKPLVSFLDGYARRFSELRELLASRRHLWLTYEEDVQSDPRVAVRRICRFLDINYVDREARLRQTNPQPLSDLVVNFDEIRRLLEQTPHAWMLEETSHA